MLESKVLIGELLAVDGLATGTLQFFRTQSLRLSKVYRRGTHVALGEVTTLEHELGNDTVEGRVGVTESVLAGSKLTEVLGGLGDNVVEELEDDAAQRGCTSDQELAKHKGKADGENTEGEHTAVGSDVEVNVGHFESN